MVTGPTSDFELLEVWRHGEGEDERRAAGDALVQRYFSQVQRFFSSSVRDDARQDLVQDTFAKLVRAKDTFRGISSFRTFLFGIARHVLNDYFRAQRWAFDPITQSVEDVDEPTPSKMVALERQHEYLIACMRALPLDTKVLLELYYWEGLTADQLGEIYEVVAATIRTRIYTARQRLRRCIVEVRQGHTGEGVGTVPSGPMEAGVSTDERVAAATEADDEVATQLRAIGKLMVLGPTAV